MQGPVTRPIFRIGAVAVVVVAIASVAIASVADAEQTTIRCDDSSDLDPAAQPSTGCPAPATRVPVGVPTITPTPVQTPPPTPTATIIQCGTGHWVPMLASSCSLFTSGTGGLPPLCSAAAPSAFFCLGGNGCGRTDLDQCGTTADYYVRSFTLAPFTVPPTTVAPGPITPSPTIQCSAGYFAPILASGCSYWSSQSPPPPVQ